jgi:DNA modification methylase
MELIKKKVKDLIPYINNSRTHSEEQITQLVSSIKEFGFTNPILLAPDNSIIAGHGRLQAVKRLGHEEVPCIIVEGLTKTQIKALIIADNQLALNAGWDLEKLSVEIEGLEADKFDLNILGFEDDFIKDLLHKENQGLTDEDAVPEIKENPKSKLGDIFVLGNHRLMCGDATIQTDVEKLMNKSLADMVFTDPPYGVNYQSNMRTKSEKFEIIKNDDVELDIVPIIKTFSKGWIFIWTTWKVLDKWLNNTKELGFPSNMVIWFKGGGGIGDLKKTFSTDYETALVWNRGAELCGKRIGSVWKINKDGATNYLHPTQKPVALALEALDKTTKSGFKVLDLFGGSGSTLIACEKLGRNGFILELDPKYCDVIIQRWQQFTGKEAIHEQTGKTYNSI